MFDNNYISYVTYDNKFLKNKESWGKSKMMTFYFDSNDDSECETEKDPFQERISCIDRIKNCMYCKNEDTCEKCKYGFTLFEKQCFPSKDYQNNLKYYTPNNGTNYYICSSKMGNCEYCSYTDFSFNKFHCSKCSNGFELNESYECISGNSNSISNNASIISSSIILLILSLIFF